MNIMKLFRLASTPRPLVAVKSADDCASPSERKRNHILYHIRRHQLAIEQCTKGPERVAELERGLMYHQARLVAFDLSPEGGGDGNIHSLSSV